MVKVVGLHDYWLRWLLQYALVEGRAKYPTVPQRRELVVQLGSK